MFPEHSGQGVGGVSCKNIEDTISFQKRLESKILKCVGIIIPPYSLVGWQGVKNQAPQSNIPGLCTVVTCYSDILSKSLEFLRVAFSPCKVEMVTSTT